MYKYGIKSFVAFKPPTENVNYRVAVGNCGNWEDIQFIELEFADNGILIQYYNYKCIDCQKKAKRKYLEYKSNTARSYSEFDSNETLLNHLLEYANQGCDFQHEPNCGCIACVNFNNKYSYRTDTINTVKKEFELV